MNENPIFSVQTTRGTLEYYFDGGCGGAVRMLNPQTIERYKALKNEHPNAGEHHVFFAFSPEQWNEGCENLVKRGAIHGGDEIVDAGGGIYGPREGVESFFAFYDRRCERMAMECDPQEVYFFEYNNHECMIDAGGDRTAFDVVERIFGAEVAQTVKRIKW